MHAQSLQLAFHHLGRAQGLSQGTCPYVSRDSKGFAWIATTDGRRTGEIVQKVADAYPTQRIQ